MVGKFISDSKVINDRFDVDYINLTTSFDLNTIGKGGFGKVMTILKILGKVCKALSSKKYDLCYMTLTAKGTGFYKDLLIVLLLKVFRKRIVYHFHNKGVKQNSAQVWKRLLYRFAFHRTQSILLSTSLYFDIVDYVKTEEVHFCANGIPDIERLRSVSVMEKDEKTPCRFLFLSNMMVEKGVLVLLRACRLLKERHQHFECHFVGAWSDFTEKAFTEVVNEYGLNGRVFAHGKKYGKEKDTFLERADIFVFPTFYHNECFPLVLIEAMQYGLPIISTPEGGIPDLVSDGETGLLVSQRNSEALANQLQLLATDSMLRKKMGKAGRIRYEERFTLTDFENNLTEIFTTVISEQKQ